QCNERPQFNDGVERHLFCGKNCAVQARTAAAAGLRPTSSLLITIIALCEISGCERPVYTSPDGTPSKYCGRAHQKLGQTSQIDNGAGVQAHSSSLPYGANIDLHGSKSCLNCRHSAAAPGAVFCGTHCEQKAGEQGTILAHVPQGHAAFHDGARSLECCFSFVAALTRYAVKVDFDSSWDDATGSPPAIKAIYALVPFPAGRERYNAYR
ncbi:hypothetical protein BD626DRAFT_400562, partial [Schizophyllum amplum]